MNWPNSTAGIKTIVILLSFVFLFVVAVLLDLQYLYLMAVTLAVLPLASYLLASVAATRFVAAREHPTTVVEGRPVTVTLRVASRGGLPQGALSVLDRLPDDVAIVAPSDNQRRPLDNWNGQQGDRSYQIAFEQRGLYRLGPVTVYSTDPLGLFAFTANIALETELVVHPTALPSATGSVGGEGVVGRRERDGKTHRGEGSDFHGVREYRTGDTLRRVHWPTTARTGKLSVMEFERAYQQDVVIALDRTGAAQRGTGRHTTLEYAIKIAATLVDRSLMGGGGVTFLTQGMEFKIQAGLDSEADRFRIFDALARLDADTETSLSYDLRTARLGEGSYIALITAHGDPAVSGLLANRVQRGDRVDVYFVEPTSFEKRPKDNAAVSPAIAGAALRLITRHDDPWEEGGRALAQILRESD